MVTNIIKRQQLYRYPWESLSTDGTVRIRSCELLPFQINQLHLANYILTNHILFIVDIESPHIISKIVKLYLSVFFSNL